MKRDYSQFLSDKSRGLSAPPPLAMLGWQAFFAQQTDSDELTETPPVRVVEVHRTGLHVLGDGIDTLVPPGPEATVGDWLLLSRDRPASSRVLRRKSLFGRRAPGTERRVQLIAANVDTVFIVTSCNRDFNVARLERYVALAFEAEAASVIVLTKADLCDDPADYATQAAAISDRVPVVVLNALGPEPREKLASWCGRGQTIAFLGMSGVGKSTLVNALLGEAELATSDIREDDSRGRHTTTRRQLVYLPDGTAVLDTPGMREIQLTDAEAGVAALFSDIEDLAARCKFRDCAHETEPGCRVRDAVAAGDLDAARLARWRKLAAEERFNTASLSERKANDRSFGKMVRSIMKDSRKR